MYLKVPNAHERPLGGVFITQVHAPLVTGQIAVILGPNAQWKEREGFEAPEGESIPRDLIDPDVDWNEAIGMACEQWHVLRVNPDQTKYERQKNMIAVRYVTWHSPQFGQTAVITTQRIFILGENGKTIDRV